MRNIDDYQNIFADLPEYDYQEGPEITQLRRNSALSSRIVFEIRSIIMENTRKTDLLYDITSLFGLVNAEPYDNRSNMENNSINFHTAPAQAGNTMRNNIIFRTKPREIIDTIEEYDEDEEEENEEDKIRKNNRNNFYKCNIP